MSVFYRRSDLVVLDRDSNKLIAAVSITIRQVMVPFHRGFFCDDQSLMYPKHKGTISVLMLYMVGYSLPSLVMIAMESFIVYNVYQTQQVRESREQEDPRPALWVVLVRHSMAQLLPFYFGVAVTHLSTNIPKYVVGRLRPHFLTVCEPDWSKINCTEDSGRYITEDVCLGTNLVDIEEARVSFPSGHSSMAMYTMVYLMIYLQYRLTWSGVVLLRPTLQLTVFYMAFYTCLTRISDYKHHWSDVLAGAALGIAVAVLVIFKVRRFYQKRLTEECPFRMTSLPGQFTASTSL